MEFVFVELPLFARFRAAYLDDEAFRELQRQLLQTPTAGAVIPEAGGLRKLRFRDRRRHHGKRGGLRVIYFWWESGGQFWLFTLYDKGEAADLTVTQRRLLRGLLHAELEHRRAK